MQPNHYEPIAEPVASGRYRAVIQLGYPDGRFAEHVLGAEFDTPEEALVAGWDYVEAELRARGIDIGDQRGAGR
jgi:hypothetical protein